MTFQITTLIILIFFYAVYLGKMLSQKRRGIQTNQIAKKKSGALFYIELLLKIATFIIIIVEILSMIKNTNALPDSLRILGIIMAILGDMVFVLAVFTMRDSWRAGIAPEDKTEMISEGIYKYSRNPAFLGFDLVYFGILLMFFNWILCGFTIFAIIMLHLQILQEEHYLSSVFGSDYLVYKSKVGRYFGGGKRSKYALGFLAFFFIEIVIALYVRDNFVRPYIGDILVVVVLYYFIRIWIPEKVKLLPLYLFVFASGVEILQYFRLVERLGLEDNPVLRIVIGSVFDIKDILCYGIGCAAIAIVAVVKSKLKIKLNNRK